MIDFLVFFYGVSLGLPDIAVPVGPTKLRIDDILIVLLVVAAFKRQHYTRFEKKIVMYYVAFFIYSLTSFIFILCN